MTIPPTPGRPEPARRRLLLPVSLAAVAGILLSGLAVVSAAHLLSEGAVERVTRAVGLHTPADADTTSDEVGGPPPHRVVGEDRVLTDLRRSFEITLPRIYADTTNHAMVGELIDGPSEEGTFLHPDLEAQTRIGYLSATWHREVSEEIWRLSHQELVQECGYDACQVVSATQQIEIDGLPALQTAVRGTEDADTGHDGYEDLQLITEVRSGEDVLTLWHSVVHDETNLEQMLATADTLRLL